ncbi:hypothetical protein KDA00_02250 [Candidatus Saccharibacteria bacterium]|nr:hypothetical protein [Candidatus Saccharibacteria bacterium]
MLFVPIAYSFAQQDDQSITLGVSPQILDITANPGESFTNTFRLTNGSKESLSIEATPKNFTPRGEEGAVNITEEDTGYSLAKWTTVSPKTTIIEAGKTIDFKATIDVPENAEAGSHFGSIVFKTLPPAQPAATTAVSQEIAPVILVRISGDIRESAEIIEFKTNQSLYSNQSKVVLTSRIKNTGNVHFKPSGKITIKDMFNKEVASMDIDQRNILPETIRQFTNEWSTNGVKIGKYTATLTVVYGSDNNIQTSSTSFTFFPYQIIIPAFLIIVLVIFVIVKFRSRISLALKVLSGKDNKG